ncbi:hypothetical protein DE146DRAFT_622504 [Phaeosphaeria sp. MPI-PUGE-AT-0046c]|nr:hypothetical protein DE146DRAFT_622504 [Phaeosphaeria sp. MPI-PUGE-AT-0046c]
MWGTSSRKDTLDAYWAFYRIQCERALHDDGRHIQCRTHKDVQEIIKMLQAGHSRCEIRDILRHQFTKQHANELTILNNSIDLAASILLMIEFADDPYRFSGARRLCWERGSLKDCIANCFDSPPKLGHEGTKLPRMFNAVSLQRIAGVHVVPTSNLLDHMRLTHDDTRLLIFNNASVLKRQSQDSMFPASLIEETLATLALLFPSDDAAVREWYDNISVGASVDSQVVMCGWLKTDDRQIEKFKHWHDRLVVLKQVFDEATPRTMSQWWHDRRNGVQWYTFWVAIVVLALTLTFGLIQSIEGALQVYGTFRDNKGN